MAEIPIDVRYDTFGTSPKNPVSHGFGVLSWLICVISENGHLLFFEKDLYSMKKFVLNKSISD